MNRLGNNYNAANPAFQRVPGKISNKLYRVTFYNINIANGWDVFSESSKRRRNKEQMPTTPKTKKGQPDHKCLYEGIILGENYDLVTVTETKRLLAPSFTVFGGNSPVAPENVLNHSTYILYNWLLPGDKQSRRTTFKRNNADSFFADKRLFTFFIFLKSNPAWYKAGKKGIFQELRLIKSLLFNKKLPKDARVLVLNSFGWFETLLLCSTDEPAQLFGILPTLRGDPFRAQLGNSLPKFITTYSHFSIERHSALKHLRTPRAKQLSHTIASMTNCDNTHMHFVVELSGGAELANKQKHSELKSLINTIQDDLCFESTDISYGLGRFDLAMRIKGICTLKSLLRILSRIRRLRGASKEVGPYSSLYNTRVNLRFLAANTGRKQRGCLNKSVDKKYNLISRYLQQARDDLLAYATAHQTPDVPIDIIKGLNLLSIYKSIISSDLERDLISDQFGFLILLPYLLKEALDTYAEKHYKSFITRMAQLWDALEYSIKERFAGTIFDIYEDYDLTSTQMGGVSRILQALTGVVKSAYRHFPERALNHMSDFPGFVTIKHTHKLHLESGWIVCAPYPNITEVFRNAGLFHETFHTLFHMAFMAEVVQESANRLWDERYPEFPLHDPDHAADDFAKTKTVHDMKEVIEEVVIDTSSLIYAFSGSLKVYLQAFLGYCYYLFELE